MNKVTNLKEELKKQFPIEVIEKMADILKAYSKCYVVFEDGEYSVRTGVLIKSEYSLDYKSFGTFKAEDFYTKKERIANYIETFEDYPGFNLYEGVRDYNLMSKYQNKEISLNELIKALNI